MKIMPTEPEPDVWSEARDLLLCWEALTDNLGQSLVNGPAESLLPLLKERKKLCDRLDALKEGYGLTAWIGETIGDRPTHAQEEARTILERLVSANERVRDEMVARMNSLKQKLAEIRQSRVANHVYHGRRRAIKGAFINARC